MEQPCILLRIKSIDMTNKCNNHTNIVPNRVMASKILRSSVETTRNEPQRIEARRNALRQSPLGSRLLKIKKSPQKTMRGRIASKINRPNIQVDHLILKFQ